VAGGALRTVDELLAERVRHLQEVLRARVAELERRDETGRRDLMSALVITGLLLAGGIALAVLIRHRLRPSRGVVAGMIAGGWGMAGQGWLGGALESAAQSLAAWMGDATSSAVGASVPGLALAIVAAIIAVDVRDRAILRVTPWLGLVLPSLAAVVGGMYAGREGALGTVGEAMLWLVRLPGALG